MKILNRLYGWYGRRTVFIFLAVVVVLILSAIIITIVRSNAPVETAEKEELQQVRVSGVDALGSESLFRVVGQVRAMSEARLQAESGGRITAVNVSLGDTVRAGTIIASLENSAQRAALLQAEGAYDASVAGAASSISSSQSAQTGLDASLSSGVNTYKNAFITADSAVRSTIDDLFSDPTGFGGFKLDAFGKATDYNAERLALEGILDTWFAGISTVSTANAETRLAEARSDVERISRFAEELAGVISRQDTTNSFTQAQKEALEAEMLSVRASLNGTSQGLESALTAIVNAKEGLERAEIAGAGGAVSLSEAQVKSALGSLRGAQAAYEKTLVRTPISGVVNALYLKAGDYAAPGMPAAVIANNSALEVITSLSEDDASFLEVGDSVEIDGQIAGIVTAIAPAIDPISGKKEVRIGVTDDAGLTNGKTVSIEFMRSEKTSSNVISVPLSALKLTAQAPQAFTVSSENTLVAHTLTLGKIQGDMVEVTEGLQNDMVIVEDARGLREGEKVEVITE